MTDVYIFDSVRTPRGKGKKDGSLHEVKPIDLGVTVLEALRERNGFDPALSVFEWFETNEPISPLRN